MVHDTKQSIRNAELNVRNVRCLFNSSRGAIERCNFKYIIFKTDILRSINFTLAKQLNHLILRLHGDHFLKLTQILVMYSSLETVFDLVIY